jgi:predicted transcriptional regulator of viral defense system
MHKLSALFVLLALSMVSSLSEDDEPDRKIRRGGGGRLGAEFLAQLDRAHIRALRFPDDWALVDTITGSREASQQLIFRLNRAGHLKQVKRGAYAVRPRSRALTLSALDLVGALDREAHLVTAGRALAVNGLSDQSFRTIVVLSPVQQRGWEWQGEKVVYAMQPAERIWGGREMKRAIAPTWIARPERAIIDSLAHPKWGVSLSQVVEAIQLARNDPGFAERIAQAAARYGNAAVARRLGFILSTLAGDAVAAPFRALIGTSRALTLLDPSGPQSGNTHPEWRLRENVPFDLIAGGSSGDRPPETS